MSIDSSSKPHSEQSKKCRMCGIVKPYSEFPPTKVQLTGVHTNCRECRSARKTPKRRKPRLPDGIKQCTKCGIQKPDSEFKPSKHGRRGLTSRCSDCIKIVSQERSPIYSQSRRAREHAAEGSFTKEDVALMMKNQKGKCWYCQKSIKKGYHIEHRVPLSRGGTNWPSNLVLSCANCNFSKHDKLPHEWNGRLL